MKVVNWTREKLKALEVAQAKAVETVKASFIMTLPGETSPIEFGTAYAKEVIDYVKHVFATNPDQPAMPNNEGREGQ